MKTDNSFNGLEISMNKPVYGQIQMQNNIRTKKIFKVMLNIAISFWLLGYYPQILLAAGDRQDFARDAALAAEAFNRCGKFLDGWSDYIDPATGLLPERIGDEKIWNGHNAAADNFPFMLISAAIVRPERFHPMLEKALVGELTHTIQRFSLPGSYDLAGGCQVETSLDRLIFQASEYAKDGMVPMSEILGPCVWSERMAALVEHIFFAAPLVTAWGALPSNDAEVNGEMLQVLCRLYWMTGRKEYLTWARRIGDAYCFEVLPGNHGVPAHFWDFDRQQGDNRLKLRDHGCEIISGLSLLYAIEHEQGGERVKSYLPAVDRMLRRAVDIAMDSLGLFYNEVDAATGEVIRANISDCWGYDLYAWVTMAIVTGDESYLAPVRKALANIHNFAGYPWEPRTGGTESHDGIADAVEGALLLLSHFPDESAFSWVEHETARMFAMQREDGTIEGWWGDGNFARTALMYAFYKTQGCRLDPWRDDLRIAARQVGDKLEVYLDSDRPWQGRLLFDRRRHSEWLGMGADYPRINAFAEWFTARPLELYSIDGLDGRAVTFIGSRLIDGVELELVGCKPLVLNVSRIQTEGE